LFFLDIALPGFLLLNLTEDIRITKEIATGGASSLYAGEIINPELMDKFDTKFVVVKYLKRNLNYLYIEFIYFY